MKEGTNIYSLGPGPKSDPFNIKRSVGRLGSFAHADGHLSMQVLGTDATTYFGLLRMHPPHMRPHMGSCMRMSWRALAA